MTEKQKEYIDTVCKQAIKKDIGKKERWGKEKHKERKLQSSFLVLLMFHAQKKRKKCHSREEPMHIIIQEQFQSESLKEFKQKDIDLQYILMCVYILKKIYLNQIL